MICMIYVTPLEKLAHAIYREFFKGKIENFIEKIIFNNFAVNIDSGYTSEPPRRGHSNEYPQCMFWSKKKNKYTPAYPSFAV